MGRANIVDSTEEAYSKPRGWKMFGLGPTELIVILVIALVVFGPSRLPKLGESVGQAVRSLREHTDKVTDEVTKSIETPATPEA